MGRNPFSEEPGEPWEKFDVDPPEEFAQDGCDHFPGEGSRTLREKYMRVELQIRVKFRVRTRVNQLSDYLAVFERLVEVDDLGTIVEKPISIPPCRTRRDDGMVGDEELMMLVHDVHLVETKQIGPVIPSVVRLYRLDNRHGLDADLARQIQGCGYGPIEIAVPLKTSSPDRETRRSTDDIASHLDQNACKVIQGTSEVVRTIPGRGTPQDVGLGSADDPVDVLSTVTAYLADDYEVVAMLQRPDHLVEAFQVESCPVHFDLYAVERGLLPPPIHQSAVPSEEHARERAGDGADTDHGDGL